MIRPVQLREILGQLGFSLPPWPQNIESQLPQDLIRNGEAYVEVWRGWQAALLDEAQGEQGLVLDLLDNLIKHKKLDSWGHFIGELLQIKLEAALRCSENTENVLQANGLLNSAIHLKPSQIIGAALILSNSDLAADALRIAKSILDLSIPRRARLICLIEIIASVDLSRQMRSAGESISAWHSTYRLCLEIAQLVASIGDNYTSESERGSNGDGLAVQNAYASIERIVSLLDDRDPSDDVGCEKSRCEDHQAGRQNHASVIYPVAASSVAVDGFSANVYRQTHDYLRHLLRERQISSIDHVVVVSGRSERIFDPCISETLGGTIAHQWDLAKWSLPTTHIPVTFTGNLEHVKICDNTLYILCGHVMPGETGFAKAASSQASITIGWFWDNHHSYTANSRLAELVDIAIPSHHYGCETLTAVQARVTRPLPLATSQWSVPTLESFADILNKRTMRHMLVGRFSEWSVSPERAEVVGLLDEYFGGDPQYDFNVSPASSMAFLHSSALNNAIDWNSSLSSLVLGVRRDLSQRFFDSMLCGCVPIVDCEVSGRALDDLKPGILEHQHYLVCNARDPRQLLEAVKDSVELAESNYGTDLRSFLLRHHMLESRLGLLIHAALAACGAVTPPLSYWNG